jgi:soluble lytic murein transglycosylase-like protein
MTGLGHGPPMTGLRHRTSRALLSALAGGLTAASLGGLGGPLSSDALGAGVPAPSPSTAEGASTSPTALDPVAEVPTVVSQRTQMTTAGRNVAHKKRKRDKRKRKRAKPTRAKRKHERTTRAKRIAGGVPAPQGAAAIGLGGPAPAPAVAADQVGALAALTDLEGLAASAQALAFYRIPLFLLPIYRAAAIQYGVPWQILAAINEVETDYGIDESVSSAGAVGWMQFMPATWTQYGVDALNAGYADPYNPVDAIFAAARYLRAAGAAKDLPAAIFAYNHSTEYVSSVLLRAKLISTYPESVITTLTCLADGRSPVTGQMAWESLAPAAPASSSATAGGLSAARALALAPAVAAAAGVGTRATRFVELRSAPHASVVAVQSGRIVGLGHSRKLGFYVILRDAHGDVFTYAGLGSIASSYTLPKTSHRSIGARHVGLRLRRGSFVAQGAVLGRVRVPRGAKDGHLRFAIHPAGDPDTIDPRPILASWALLGAAVHLPPKQAPAQGGGDLLQATTTATTSDVLVLSKSQLERDLNRILAGPRPTGATSSTGTSAAPHAAAARSASSGRTAPAPASGQMSTAQWNRLIARIGALRAPAVAVKPSSSAIGDAGRLKDGW